MKKLILMQKKNQRCSKKDRSNAKYSEVEFRRLSRTDQLKLARQYWSGAVADFDDGTFQFSYSHFAKICESLGFQKGIVDLHSDKDVRNMVPDLIIYIDRGRREETVEKKFTLSKTTVEKIEKLIESKEGKNQLSNIEKSKTIYKMLAMTAEQMLQAKELGKFSVAYRQHDPEILI